jgi:hypothetical protein
MRTLTTLMEEGLAPVNAISCVSVVAVSLVDSMIDRLRLLGRSRRVFRNRSHGLLLALIDRVGGIAESRFEIICFRGDGPQFVPHENMSCRRAVSRFIRNVRNRATTGNSIA